VSIKTCKGGRDTAPAIPAMCQACLCWGCILACSKSASKSDGSIHNGSSPSGALHNRLASLGHRRSIKVLKKEVQEEGF
jgi:hypothetical protein